MASVFKIASRIFFCNSCLGFVHIQIAFRSVCIQTFCKLDQSVHGGVSVANTRIIILYLLKRILNVNKKSNRKILKFVFMYLSVYMACTYMYDIVYGITISLRIKCNNTDELSKSTAVHAVYTAVGQN